MCGIYGIYSVRNESDFPGDIGAMRNALEHRGPDGNTTWIDQKRGIALGHARLAIIDLKSGAQPMADDSGACRIVFNGEIYNYLEIRKQLGEKGVRFRTESDTEVILCGYRLWGRDILEHLNGMYAFAIFDERNQSLFLARDRTGIKPLYYYSGNDRFVFASEMKAILSDGSIPRNLDYQALSDFLTLGCIIHPKTMFADIRELSPGTCMTVTRPGAVDISRRWTWKREKSKITFPEAKELTKRTLVKSLEDHLVSDVPVGAFLSGGIDSSAIAVLIGKELGRTIDTFHVSFGESSHDESPYADKVAAIAGSRHHTLRIENDTANMDDLRKIALQFDQPFSDTSAIPSYYICREIRKHVKTALGGDGGDEMFGGYDRFRYAIIAGRLALLSRPVIGMLLAANRMAGMASPDLSRKLFRLLTAARSRNDERLLSLSYHTYPDKLGGFIREIGMSKIDGYRPGFGSSDDRSGDGDAYIDATVRYILPDDYLKKVDMMSSAHGLEVRVPFLGNDVLDLAARLPTEFKFNARESKMLLRAVLRDYLPQELVNRKKQGFDIPLDTYLGAGNRRIMASEVLDDTSLLGTLIRREVREELCGEFAAGNYSLANYSRYMVYNIVYMLWCLKLWLDKWQPAL